ncbi:tRNA lysidine(34) synthetase TilS [Alteriqipengyuania lutimaris]|uniref:tRNA lysidine(34) synthetase TilS n=1 Tax=Alteriqipengyuania lutimaris TaxID=1538146 RepID=UPI00299D79CA|nr:tRNA lysidine(34) synthetase TilS [Alteriqipengyuania lutimaris]
MLLTGRPPDPALIERFRADLAQVWPDDPDLAGVSLGIAVSGGPDSLALLLLANAAMPGRVRAATVDHGLRPESADEAAFVARVCEGLGIPHATLRVEVAPGNLQANARAARYEALGCHFEQVSASVFATAHHADDQAETLLMRLNRGSGLAGLAGVRPWSVFFPEGIIAEMVLVRPLLGWRREELAAVVRAAGIEAVDDPSNSDDAFDRARMRKAIAEADWLDPLAMARSARHLAEAENAVEDYVSSIANRLIWRDGACYFCMGYPRLVEIGVVERILERLGGTEVRRSEIARMVDRLRTRENASLGGVLAKREWVKTGPNTTSDSVKFEKEPPRRA